MKVKVFYYESGASKLTYQVKIVYEDGTVSVNNHKIELDKKVKNYLLRASF